MKRFLLILVFCISVLFGCTPYKAISISDINISNIDSIEYDNETVTGTISVSLEVENPNKTPLEITSCEAVIYLKEKQYGYAINTNPVIITPTFEGKVIIPFSITINNPLSLLSLGIQNIGKIDTSDVIVDYDIKVKNGNFTKKLSDKKVPLSSLITLLENTK